VLAVETSVVELHFVLGRVAESDSLFALALVASDSDGSTQSRVFDVVFLVSNLLLIASLIAFVDTVEVFFSLLNDFLECADLALESQLAFLLAINLVLERVEHIVTLFAESHSSVCACHK